MVLLQADPSLAEVPGLSSEQLQSLAGCIESKQRKLESDIHAYVSKKQRELAQYEHELVAHYRQIMDRNGNGTLEASNSTHPQNQDPPSPIAQLESTDEKARRTKHTRVHKREKELFGLVTPIFLPLLDAGEAAPAKKEKKKRRSEVATETSSPDLERSASPARDAENENGKELRKSRSKSSDMLAVESIHHDPPRDRVATHDSLRKKSKRPAMKKSSLRSSSEKGRRKRVSLVIDDQIVLPADQIPEPAPTSPSDTAVSSASTSTTSVDEVVPVDPRLLSPREPRHEDQGPVHHHISLPDRLPLATPSMHTGHTLPDSPVRSPPIAASPRSPRTAMMHEPPQTATRTFLEPSPTSASLNIPKNASADPIYASAPERAEMREENFSTYVGGIDGSGVDDVDQTGSLGYPSSLGASYMEQYMKNRPMSVRISAAEKAGLGEEEKAALIGNKRDDDVLDVGVSRVENVDDDMEIIGAMDGF